MSLHTVVIESCRPETANEEVALRVAGMLGQLPGIDARLAAAKRIFVKLNLGLQVASYYKGRPIDYTDPAVFQGLADYMCGRTDAVVLVGDGSLAVNAARAAEERGHMAVVRRAGFQFLDLNEPPFARFDVPNPTIFRWYDLSAALQGVDLCISVAKMKALNRSRIENHGVHPDVPKNVSKSITVD